MKKFLFKSEFTKIFLLSFLTYLIFFGKFLLPNYFFRANDASYYYLPVREYLYEKITKEFSFPFWTERAYLGFPIYADIETGYLNPINILSIVIFGPENSYKFLHLICYLIGSVSLYYFLKKYQISIYGFIAANLIYFFNLFIINYQIYFNIAPVIYLFPASIFLIDKFLETKKFKFILIQSIILAFNFLLGHTQTFFIYSMGIIIYYLLSVNGLKFKIIIKNSIIYLFFISILFFIQTTPQILPTYDLFKESLRNVSFNYTEGSFYPKMFALVFYPNLLTQNENYLGQNINPYFYEIEIYLYFGVVAFLLFIFGLFFTKLDKFTYFAFISLCFFVVLASSRFNPFFNENTPVISIFRNWHRFIFVFYLAGSIVVAKLITNLGNWDNNNLQLKTLLLLIPGFYLIILQLGIKETSESNLLNSLLSFSNLYKHENMGIILSLILLVLLFYWIYKLNKISLKSLKIIIVTLILMDCLNSGSRYINGYLKKEVIYNFDYEYLKEKSDSQRIIIKNANVSGFDYLKLSSWSPFGISNFIAEDFYNYFKHRNLETFYFSYIKENTTPELDYSPQEFGIKEVYSKTENIFQRIYYNPKNIELIENDILGEYLIKKEGQVVLKLNTLEDKVINTKLRYSPFWEIKINGQKVAYEKNEIFITFSLSKGENIVEFKYIPKPFYLGLYISGVLLILLIVILIVNRKYKLIEI